MDYDERKSLAEEALEFAEFNRRKFLSSSVAAGSMLAAGGLASTLGAKSASAQEPVRVGIPLNYGPFNQPWRRGCWQLVQTVLDLGGEPVTVRGEPTKQSEQEAELALLDRGIDVLCLGIYSQESETAFIVDRAHERGIKTIGFAVPVKDSPAVLEDSFGTGLTLGYFMQNYLNRQGAIVQTAEDKGFYTPFDMEADQVDVMTKYEPRMEMLPFMPGSVSTTDQISKGRENMLSLLQAHPEPGSVAGLISWWWPLTIGAAQAMQQAGGKGGGKGMPMPFGKAGGGSKRKGKNGRKTGGQRVKIPRRAAGDVPGAWREEILEAWGEGFSGPSRGAVDRYYRDLVR
ncbi:MAG: sugar ABC transporter substrate-binding protein [Rhodospirillaceae bacterium]|nr:sugar ABC transporter substrate-binding protein [Rhodospirillaceae bacterium]